MEYHTCGLIYRLEFLFCLWPFGCWFCPFKNLWFKLPSRFRWWWMEAMGYYNE